MNDTLKTILDMDKTAQQKVAEAEEYRKNAIAGLSAKKAAVIEDETKKARESAKRRSERRKAQGEKNLAEIQQRNEKILDRMENLYKDNADKWVSEIVSKVTE